VRDPERPLRAEDAGVSAEAARYRDRALAAVTAANGLGQPSRVPRAGDRGAIQVDRSDPRSRSSNSDEVVVIPLVLLYGTHRNQCVACGREGQLAALNAVC
jgi:hypothetical protein